MAAKAKKKKKKLCSISVLLSVLTSSKLILLVTKILNYSCFDHLQTCSAFIYIPPSRHLHGTSSAVQAALWLLLLYLCRAVWLRCALLLDRTVQGKEEAAEAEQPRRGHTAHISRGDRHSGSNIFCRARVTKQAGQKSCGAPEHIPALFPGLALLFILPDVPLHA